jgi:protein ImuB
MSHCIEMPMLWLQLHFPQLPLEVFIRAQEPQSAIAVIEKNRVLCHDTSAGDQGIRPGMSSSTAQALCAGLLLLERQRAREKALMHGLADWCYRFTSLLSLQEPDRLLLEIGSSLRLFGGLQPLLLEIGNGLLARGHAYRSGIAPTPAGAQLMADAAPAYAPLHAMAWQGCDQVEAFRERIDTLSIDLLDVAEKQRLRMRQMGLSRIGELRALPRAALGKRFGRDFLLRLKQLCGEHPDPRPCYRPREFFHSGLHMPDPLHSSTALLFPMQRLLYELGEFLDRRQAYCQQLDWRLRDIRGTTQSLAVACSLQHNNHAALLNLTRLRLERLRIGDAVQSLTLLCRRFAPVQQQSAELFPDPEQHCEQAETLLLDRLLIRLGAEHVHGIRLADAHLPELASQRTDLHEKSAASGSPPAGQRPCWLLPQPLALQNDARGLHWNGLLRLLNGPERIECNWWSAPQKRDYYTAEHENGSICWVFCSHPERAWFLHGFFG